MSLPARVTTFLVAFAVVVAGLAFVAIHFIGSNPPVVDYTHASGGQVNVVMQTDPQNTVTNKPDWVSYFIQDPQTKQWVHTTYFAVPAATKVNMTIEGYDGCSALRNPVWNQVTGTIGGVEYVNGKAVSELNSWSGCNVQHTFTMAALGINVPIAAPPTLKQENALCSTSPCTSGSGPYEAVTFSFMTPAQGGTFRWQCIVPCGSSYLDGNGGPMATPGYMSGQMDVQA
ncbi:MAG: hypothetical protein M3Z75_10210 [Actinomycetota bacterium]|nr:hypothetical protein [Actinomycetota bacterium]